MSLTFGPAFLLGNPTEASAVTVITWDGLPVTLDTPVVINSDGKVTFTVKESGKYRIIVRGTGEVFSIHVALSDGPDYDPTSIRNTVDWLVDQVLSGGSGGSLPTGTPDQIMSFAVDGSAISTRLTPDHWSDFEEGAPTSGDWVAVAQFTHPEFPEMGFVKCSVDADETTIPQRITDGRLIVGTPVATNEATTKEYVDNKTKTSAQISDASALGRNILKSVDAAAARTLIGAGTSNVAIGTTSGTAADAATTTTALAGKAATTHNQAATTVTVAASTGIVGANAQAVLADLAARVAALETP